MADDREFNVKINEEEGMLWAEVSELPGVFASGETIEELLEALVEAINLVEPAPVETAHRRFRKPAVTRPSIKHGDLAISV